MAEVRGFALAPMSTALRVLTWICLFVPVALFCAALTAPPPTDAVLGASLVFVILIYASVWLVFRPTRFEVSADGLRIVWPVRQQLVPLHELRDAVLVSSGEFRHRYGWGARIGAGGLWGGFGLLKTRSMTFSMWISRTDPLVLVRRSEGRPLLITPERPQEFVEALERVIESRA